MEAVEKNLGNNGVRLKSIVGQFIEQSPENTLTDALNEPAWENPLVGFSRGNDPVFDSLKKHVGTLVILAAKAQASDRPVG